jgi:hypothetical protein
MEKKVESTGNNVEELENRLAKLEKKERRRKIRKNTQESLAYVGAGGAAAGTYAIAGDSIKKLSEGIGETIHGARKATELASVPFRDKELTKKYIGELSLDLQQSYRENLDMEPNPIFQGLKEAGKSGQRGSTNIPGMESNTAKGLRGFKGWLIEKTKSIGGNADEASIQNSEQYLVNENEMQRLQLSAIGKRESIRGEMGKLAQKLELSIINTNQLDKEGLEKMEGLVREYNSTSELIGNIGELDIRQRNEGMADDSYSNVMEQAQNYGILPYDSSGAGNIGLGAGLVLSGIVGYKIAKPIVKGAFGVYDAGKFGAKIGYKAGKVIGKGTGVGIKGVKSVYDKLPKRRRKS